MNKTASQSKKDQTKYWHQVAAEIREEEARLTRKDRIKNYDFTVTLPLKLKKRVEKIIPYEFDDFDQNAFLDEYELDEDNDLAKALQRGRSFDDDELENLVINSEYEEEKQVEFAESQCSLIKRMEHDFVDFDLKLHKPIQLKKKEKKKVNWCSTYLCKKRKERILWDSKIYQFGDSMEEKTLDEKADILIEAAAERFSTWLNSLSDSKQSNMSTEYLKNLFAVGADRMLFASIQTEPKELKAIAKAVADVWHLPDMALELKYEEYLKTRLKERPKKFQNVVFGRTVPTSLRPWVPTAHDGIIKTVFPKQILSGENIFKGLKHLRSTKALIEFYKSHPNFTAPSYFNRKRDSHRYSSRVSISRTPLYDKLKLAY